MTRFVLAIGLLAACGPSNEAKEVCQKAADRYVQCVGEVLGEEAKAMVSSPQKDGREACARVHNGASGIVGSRRFRRRGRCA